MRPVFGERGATKAKTNPMLALGAGPDGATCKTCRHLTWHETAHRYYKCTKYGLTYGPATDHRQKWPACRLYEVAP